MHSSRNYLGGPLCAGVRSSYPVLWALPRGEPVWASALTARPAKLWSQTWRDQKCLQQQEHLLTLPLALLPVLQELSHLPLPILHLWATFPAYWKVSNFYRFYPFQIRHFSSQPDKSYKSKKCYNFTNWIDFLLTGTSLTSCKMCRFPPLRDRAS